MIDIRNLPGARYIDEAEELGVGIDVAPAGRTRGDRTINGADSDGDAEEQLAPVEWVAAALACLPNDGSAPQPWDTWAGENSWSVISLAVFRATEGSEEGFEVFRAWSAQHPTYRRLKRPPGATGADRTRTRWEEVRGSPPDDIGWVKLRWLAEQYDPDFDPVEGRGTTRFGLQGEAAGEAGGAAGTEGTAAGSTPTAPPQRLLQLIDPTTLANVPVPTRQWVVPDWVPIKRATGLYGVPSAGKTLLMQMLCTSCAIGALFLGMPVRRCRSILHYCEDDLEEMHIRQEAINRHYGCTWADTGDMRWLPRIGEDNTLMRFGRDGRGKLTPLFDALLIEAKAFGAELIIEDTLADVFGGSEIDRGQSRRFVQEGLARIARECSSAVVCCAHPSLSGISSDAGTSGSTGWDGAFRSRLYMRHLHEDEETNEPTGDERLLMRKKANWAKAGGNIEMEWRDGVFVKTSASDGVKSPLDREAVDRTFLALLDKLTSENTKLSSNSRAGNYAPRVFARRPEKGRLRIDDLEAAMHRLLAAGEISNIDYGRPSDARTRIVRCIKAPVSC